MFEFLNYILIANVEIVCLLILGTLFQMTDGSPFQIIKKWDAVWSTDLPREYFSPIVQRILKTGAFLAKIDFSENYLCVGYISFPVVGLSIIVAARCGATYPYVATAMLVIFCLLKDRAPKLMLPWIFIAAVKSIGITFLETLAGVYVCSAFGKIHKACIEFLISKALEIIFAAYLWGSVLSVYHDLERRLENQRILQNPEIAFIKNMDLKRKRARSLLDEATLYKTACINNFEFKDVPRIILQMLRRPNEMSQDSLLGPGMMLASVSNMGSFDNLKKSESLGELGYTNLQSTKVIGLDDEENLSPAEKALKFLKLTWSDVRRAQQSESCLENDIRSINSDSWFRVSISDAHVYKPKQTRTEIYIRELPEVEIDDDKKFQGKNLRKLHDIKLGISLFNLLKKNALNYNAATAADDDDDETFVDIQEESEEEEVEAEDDEEMSRIFMSNIKEEKPVNRIGLNISGTNHKGTAYYKLYKKDFMSVIGPEVFERATRLPKVTSFAFRKLSTEKSLSGKNSSISSQSESPKANLSAFLGEDFCAARETQRESIHCHTGNKSKEESKKEMELKIKESEFASQKSSDEKRLLWSQIPPPYEEGLKVKKIRPPPYRKRRIRIKWIGKLRENNLIECVSPSSSFTNASNDSVDFERKPEKDFDEDDTNSDDKMKIQPLHSGVSYKKINNSDEKFTKNRKMYFLMELLHEPLPEVLKRYYDLKNTMYTRRKSSTMSQKHFDFTNNFYEIYFLKRFKEINELGGKNYKVWKSNVLKIAEANQHPITGSFINEIHQNVINKLLRYQRKVSTSKVKEDHNSVSMTSLLLADAEDSKNNYKRCLIKLTSSNSRNELCMPHSGNVFQSREILNEGNDITCSNKRNFSETPSEHSIELYRKDLINGEIYNSEQVQSPLAGCAKDGEFKTSADGEEFENAEDGSICSQESDEPISLYYSKAANLASPLLDMKKFIYPDHIHYSYKHVNKKGFDVNISGDLPLLVQSQALAKNRNLHVRETFAKPEPEISKRPMDLSFAKTNAFAEWQNSDQNVSDVSAELNENSKKIKITPKSEENSKRKMEKNSKKKKTSDDETNSPSGTLSNSYHVYFTKSDTICEKPKTMSNQSSEKVHNQLTNDEERTPVQISSTQLHSNKGRINSLYNPALRLQENKKEVKKKAEAQEKRSKDMLAKREFFFLHRNGCNSSKP